MNLVAIMEAGRRDFLDAIREVSPEQAAFKPAPDRWSALECIEHVVTVEDHHLGWLSNGTADTAQRNSEKEMRLFTTIRSRLTKVESPEAVRPQGRFGTLAAALAAFEAVRDRTVTVIQKSGDALYSMGAKHPYFGKVNGAELIQLIDGHARRHADQIRENCELFLTAKLCAGGEAITIRGDHLHDVQWANLRTGAFNVESSVLERVHLAGGQFGTVLWQDVRLVGCDLANVRADRLVLARVELIDCRLTGMAASDADWQDVTIRNSDLQFSQFQDGTFRNCEFNGCNWQEADLQNADLSGVVFQSCNFARADVRGAKLEGADFRTSEMDGLVAGIKDMRGAIVDPAQSMILAQMLGLRIS